MPAWRETGKNVGDWQYATFFDQSIQTVRKVFEVMMKAELRKRITRQGTLLERVQSVEAFSKCAKRRNASSIEAE
jgi:hypothetical protein